MKLIYKAAFLAHARSKRFQEKVANSLDILQRYIDSCKNPAVAVSFGKDSLVMLHLSIQIKPSILCFHIERGEGGDTQDVLELKNKVIEKFSLNFLTEHTLISALEAFKTKTDIKKYLIKSVNKLIKENIIDGVAMGLAFDESRERRIAILKHGCLYKMKDGLVRAYPIGNWTSKDVWAYIIANEIPYPKIYDEYAEIGIHYTSPMSRFANMIGTSANSVGRANFAQMANLEHLDFYNQLPSELRQELNI